MPEPTRPSTGGPIESSWGQETHDQSFTPLGGRFGAGGANVGATIPCKLSAISDPAGLLGATDDTLTIPTDGDGMYLVKAWLSWAWDNPGRGYAAVRVAGSINHEYREWSQDSAGGGQGTTQSCLLVIPLVPGDTLQFPASAPSSAFAAVDVTITRIGRSWGLS